MSEGAWLADQCGGEPDAAGDALRRGPHSEELEKLSATCRSETMPLMRIGSIIALAWTVAALPGRAKTGEPLNVNLCDVVSAPAQLNGKIVTLRGRVQLGFEDFELSAADCDPKKTGVWLEYGSGPKRQPTTWCCGDMVPRDPLAMVENDNFRRFHRYLTAQSRSKGCTGQCPSYNVTATLTGRLDTVGSRACRDGRSQCCDGGFGHLGAFCVRLVIQSVSNIDAQPVIR